MGLQELVTKRVTAQNDLCCYVHDALYRIKVLADNMAESATDIRGQGYISFVTSRSEFLDEVDRLHEEISTVCKCNSANA